MDSKIKVFYLGRYNNTENLNGPEKFAKRIFQYIPEYNVEAYFIEYFFRYTNRKSSLYNRFFGIEIINRDNHLYRMGIFRLFLFLVKEQPEIIHIVTLERFILPLYFYKFLLKSKIIITLHGLIYQEIHNNKNLKFNLGIFIDLFLEKASLVFSDRFVFLTETQIQLVQKYYNLYIGKKHIIPNGIDEDFLEPAKKAFSEEKIKLVFYLGNNTIYRGIDLVINEINRCKYSERIELYIIGEILPNLPTSLYFKIKKVPQMSKSDLIYFLQDKHIVIKSTTFDTLPFFVGECMANGLIPIVSTNTGICEFISNGVNGFIYEDTFYNIIDNLFFELSHNSGYILRISENAKQILRVLDWKATTEKYYQAYLDLLK